MIDYLPKFNRRIDPQFKSLFKRRWREKAQRAKMKMSMIEATAELHGGKGIESAVEEYIEIVGFLDGGLPMKIRFGMESFTRAMVCRQTEGEIAACFSASQ
jgi:hypothetical protein